MALCKRCSAVIFWQKNHNGNWIPYNPDKTNHLENCGTDILKFRIGYKNQGVLRGRFKVAAFKNPISSGYYSFSISLNDRVCRFNEISLNPDLKGCFDSIFDALEAGVRYLFDEFDDNLLCNSPKISWLAEEIKDF